MEITVEHKYTQEIALEKMKNFFDKMKQEYGNKITDLSENWNGNSGDYQCKFNGMQLSGHIDINPNDVTLNGKIPFFALPFKGAIETTIRLVVTKALEDNNNETPIA